LAAKRLAERFVRGVPKPPDFPVEVSINKPKAGDESTDEFHIKF
jgi:hypothetical protein